MHPFEITSLLDHRLRCVDHRHRRCENFLWIDTAGKCLYNLFLLVNLCPHNFRIWPCPFQLCAKHSAGNVHDILLCDHLYLYERFIHSHRQYAGLGAVSEHVQSIEIFHYCDAVGILKRKFYR